MIKVVATIILDKLTEKNPVKEPKKSFQDRLNEKIKENKQINHAKNI